MIMNRIDIQVIQRLMLIFSIATLLIVGFFIAAPSFIVAQLPAAVLPSANTTIATATNATTAKPVVIILQ